ncbi:D-alanyl-D-alanine carboxypeptidase family protein [Sporofaciens sp. SGI.106]|uniref:D-alanyl-D-alanine carboxypeptidase family protein n=1 Tax=Sporofaciens sp. SGI.106 TaxID=3420568 RepID=UPI003CFEBAA1
MKIWKKFFAIAAGFLAVLVICGAGTEENPEELSDLYARSAVLMDADSGRVLFGKEETAVLPMASTTKIMTCILVLENSQTDEIASVSQNAASQPKVRLGVQEGEHYRIEHLLYSLMLESHNDSAVVLAEHVAGSVEEFAKLMNQKAVELGCRHTYFITPNGLDAEDEKGKHATTAEELAKIMRYCIMDSTKKEEFLQITGTAEYEFQNEEGNRSFHCSNHNAFLTMMEGALSGKTGFTADAGYCYVGALRRNERTFIVALLACGWPNNKGYKWSDTRKLMEYGLEHYHYRNVWHEIKLSPVTVENGIVEQTDIIIQNEPEEWKLLLHEDEEPKREVEVKEQLRAPVKKGEQVGILRYRLEDEVIGSWEIVTCSTIRKRVFWDNVEDICKSFFL